jgi:hypothetical protein
VLDEPHAGTEGDAGKCPADPDQRGPENDAAQFTVPRRDERSAHPPLDAVVEARTEMHQGFHQATLVQFNRDALAHTAH